MRFKNHPELGPIRSAIHRVAPPGSPVKKPITKPPTAASSTTPRHPRAKTIRFASITPPTLSHSVNVFKRCYPLPCKAVLSLFSVLHDQSEVFVGAASRFEMMTSVLHDMTRGTDDCHY